MVETPGSGNAPFTLPTLAEIRAWVAGLPGDEIVGTCNEPEHCLIAHAAEARNPGMAFVVNPSSWEGDISGYVDDRGYREKLALPAALNRLAQVFDDQDVNSSDSRNRDMTAAETLPIIDRVMQEVGQ